MRGALYLKVQVQAQPEQGVDTRKRDMMKQGEEMRRSGSERLIVQLKGSRRWGYIAGGGVDSLLEILERARY